jgi:hypothetical protein
MVGVAVSSALAGLHDLATIAENAQHLSVHLVELIE